MRCKRSPRSFLGQEERGKLFESHTLRHPRMISSAVGGGGVASTVAVAMQHQFGIPKELLQQRRRRRQVSVVVHELRRLLLRHGLRTSSGSTWTAALQIRLPSLLLHEKQYQKFATQKLLRDLCTTNSSSRFFYMFLSFPPPFSTFSLASYPQENFCGGSVFSVLFRITRYQGKSFSMSSFSLARSSQSSAPHLF